MSGVFNIRKFIETELEKTIGKSFRLMLFTAAEDKPQAFVGFDPLTLNVDKDMWEDAKYAEPVANFQLAHEVIHLALHDYGTLHFTTESEYSRRAPEDERNVEWQAEVGAHFLLCPEEIRSQSLTPLEAEARFGVPRAVYVSVKRSRPHADAFRAFAEVHYGEFECKNCGNLTVAQSGAMMRCDTCGSTMPVS